MARRAVSGSKGAHPHAPRYRHCVDQCTPHEIAGWSTAPKLEVAINDRLAGTIGADIPRADLADAGIDGGHGFRFFFDQSLWLDDQVSIRAEDGSDLRCGMDDRFRGRVSELTRYVDVRAQVGLEVGPLDRPVVPKSRFRVHYLDQAPKAELEKRFRGQGVNLTSLVDPDFAVGHASFADAVGDLRFDYCLASHVIEHVPDMVGWLWEIWSVLKGPGVLALAIPHGEKTFDAKRRLSSMADLVDAYFGKLKQPGPRQIIDAQVGSALYHNTSDAIAATFNAFHQANHARKVGLYVDLHCNVFTPASFAHNLQCLDRCELLGFDLLSMAYRGDDEFIVHLRKRPDKVLPDHIRP